MSDLPPDLASCTDAIPLAMEELTKSHASVKQIADYCKSNFKESGEHFTETKDYTNQALQNVVYHIHHVGLQLSHFLDVQSKELEKLDLQIKTLTERMRSCHDATGTFQKQGIEAPKLYQRTEKAIKYEELPEAAQPPPVYVRQPLDLSALDSVGHSGRVTTMSETRSYQSSTTIAAAPSHPEPISPPTPLETRASAPPPSISVPPSISTPPVTTAPPVSTPPPAALPRDDAPPPALPRDEGGPPPALPRDGGGGPPPALPRDGGGGPPPALPRDGGPPPALPRDGGGPPPLPRDGGGPPPALPRDGGGPPPLPRDGGPPPLPRD